MNFEIGTLRKWTNGGGKVQDWVEIAKSVYVDETSKVKDHAEVRGEVSLRSASLISGEARVFDQVDLFESVISGNARVSGNVEMAHSHVGALAQVSGRQVRMLQSVVGGDAVINGVITLKNTLVNAKARVYDFVSVIDSTVTDCATVCESARLEGITACRDMRIHEGVWTRPPKYIDTGKVQMTECVDGKVIIGCQCRSIKWWYDHAEGMAQLYGLTAVELDRLREAMKEFE